MKTIPLMKSQKRKSKLPFIQVGEVQVDDADYLELSKYVWGMNAKGYARRTDNKSGKPNTYIMHRVILGAKPGEVCDHIDRNRKNNQRSNLRITDWKGNANNRTTPIMTEDWKRNISISQKGLKRSEQGKKNISESLLGHNVSQDTKEKISASLKRYYQNVGDSHDKN